MFKKTLTAIITATALFGLNANAFAFIDSDDYIHFLTINKENFVYSNFATDKVEENHKNVELFGSFIIK